MANRLFPAAVVATLAAIFAAGSAPAQRVDPILQLQSDVIRLESLVKDLQRSTDLKLQNLQSLLERVVDRTNLMGTEIKTLQTGAQTNAQSSQSNIDKITRILEETRAQNDKTNKELAAALQTLNADMTAMNNRLGEKLAVGLNEKIDKLGEKLNQNISGMQLQIDAQSRQIANLAEKQQVTPLPSCEQMLRDANGDLSAGMPLDFVLDGFRGVAAKCPNHPVAALAELGIGKAFFDHQKWAEAGSAFESVLLKYKEQDIKKTALYKRGLSLANQNLKDPAREALQQVVNDFPGTTEATNAQEELKKLTPPPATPPRGAGTAPRGTGTSKPPGG